MEDLTSLEELDGSVLTAGQIRGILQQIDLDVANLLRDGKLSALRYAVGGEPGVTMDRATNLKMLLEARKHYEQLLQQRVEQEEPAWITATVQFPRNRTE